MPIAKAAEDRATLMAPAFSSLKSSRAWDQRVEQKWLRPPHIPGMCLEGTWREHEATSPVSEDLGCSRRRPFSEGVESWVGAGGSGQGLTWA